MSEIKRLSEFPIPPFSGGSVYPHLFDALRYSVVHVKVPCRLLAAHSILPVLMCFIDDGSMITVTRASAKSA